MSAFEIEKVYQPETIQDEPMGSADQAQVAVDAVNTSSTPKPLSPGEQVDKQFPEIPVAREVISTSLDTQSRKILGAFEFGQVGSIQIGVYEFGVSGEIKISPNGIYAKNINGASTFTLDATTGDATFAGTLAAGTIIAGSTQIGDTSNVTLDGANKRILINDGTNARFLIGYHANGF